MEKVKGNGDEGENFTSLESPLKIKQDKILYLLIKEQCWKYFQFLSVLDFLTIIAPFVIKIDQTVFFFSGKSEIKN